MPSPCPLNRQNDRACLQTVLVAYFTRTLASESYKEFHKDTCFIFIFFK